MVLTAKIIGVEKVRGFQRFFKRARKDLEKDIMKQSNNFGNAVIRRAKEHYLTGGGNSQDRLNVRSGNLRSKVRFLLESRGGGKDLILSFGTDVIYARIHEKGGTTKPHVIRPKKEGGWLRFFKDGNLVFAKKVNHPGSVIPPRPFIGPSIDDNLPDFFDNIKGSMKRLAKRKVPKK